jgi:hypothetical protein
MNFCYPLRDLSYVGMYSSLRVNSRKYSRTLICVLVSG